jgi:hypothetical protein
MRSIRSYLTAPRAARPSNRPSYQPRHGASYARLDAFAVSAVEQGFAFLDELPQPGLGRPE